MGPLQSDKRTKSERQHVTSETTRHPLTCTCNVFVDCSSSFLSPPRLSLSSRHHLFSPPPAGRRLSRACSHHPTTGLILLLSVERRCASCFLSVVRCYWAARTADLYGVGSVSSPAAGAGEVVNIMANCFGFTRPKLKAPKNQHSKIQTFPFHLLQQVTNNFDEEQVVGKGGFGKVYRGVLEDGTRVAVKRKDPGSSQGLVEFQVEIELLQELNHPNLVSLIGYCDEGNEMILIYEYMENGTLTSHLYGSDEPSLDWKQRLEAVVGAAKGLQYLHAEHYVHTGSAKAIIHRDVKSANILLDYKLCAKVGDFGISKTGPELDQTHVTTLVKGSFGYLDLEYYKTQQLTEKSDVYSFGVVLLEVLCGRPAIDRKLLREKVNLAEWGMKMLNEGKLEQIVDQKISSTIKPCSLDLFGKIVAKCLADERNERPSMEDVLRDLEMVLSKEDKNPFKRSVGKMCLRASNVPDDISAPSTTTSHVSPVLDEGISVAGHGVSSQLIQAGERKPLARSLAFRRDDLSGPSRSQVSPVLDEGISAAGN
ncbi:hypothetical protein EJB05_16195, partial [Eragrostis curvula]